MNVEQAVKEVEALLLSKWDDSKAVNKKVDIVTWSDTEGQGVRVAEVSFTATHEAGMFGWSFMQVDSEAAVVCFFAERAILARVLSDYPQEEREDDDQRLLDAAWKRK